MIRKLLPLFFLLLVAAANTSFAGDQRATGIGDTPPKNWLTFDQLDANHDGKVTADELKAEIEKNAQERFSRYDTDRDGRISPHEFLIFRHHRPPIVANSDTNRVAERHAKKTDPDISTYDTDASGHLNRDEFDQAMRDTSALRFDRIDRDHNELITRDELAAALATAEAPREADPAKRRKSAAPPAQPSF